MNKKQHQETSNYDIRNVYVSAPAMWVVSVVIKQTRLTILSYGSTNIYTTAYTPWGTQQRFSIEPDHPLETSSRDSILVNWSPCGHQE